MMMKYIIFIVMFVMIYGCAKEVIETRDYPRLKTLDVSNITEKGVVFNAKILSLGNDPVLEQGFIFANYEQLNMEYSEIIKSEGVNKVGGYNAEIPRTSLLKGGKLYVRAYVKTVKVTVMGNVVGFYFH
jgi:hypothetical protein